MNNFSDYCTKLFGEHSCTEEDCPYCPSAKIIAEYNARLLDKVAERIKGRWLFRGTDGNPYRDIIDEVIAELKAEVSK